MIIHRRIHKLGTVAASWFLKRFFFLSFFYLTVEESVQRKADGTQLFLRRCQSCNELAVVREALLHINNFFTLLRCETPGVPLYEGWQCVICTMCGAVAACASHLLTRGDV